MRANPVLVAAVVLLLGTRRAAWAVPGCPPRDPATAEPGKLHIFTLSVEFETGRPTVSLFQQTTCPGGTNRSTCPVTNLADVVQNPMSLHPERFKHGFTVTSKPLWLAAALEGLPPNDLVAFVDGSDVVYGGCGNAPDAGGLSAVLRARLLALLARSGASVVFGAEVNRYDIPSDHAVPSWALGRCPHLTNANGKGDWIYAHTDCPRPDTETKQRPLCEASMPGGNPAIANVNSGSIFGYVCEVRATALALAEVWQADPKRLRGAYDGGKYFSYFMDDVKAWPAAQGIPSDVTLDYCGDLVLNMWRSEHMPLVFNSSFRTISLDVGAPGASAGTRTVSEPLCFLHFNGRAWTYKLFETVAEFNGVRCRPKKRESQKTGVCSKI